MTRAFCAACWWIAVCLLMACGPSAGTLLPKSGGRPYETLVVYNNVEAGHLVAHLLSADADVLPQAEPCFDVSLVDSVHFSEALRLARSIVIVTVDPTMFTKTRLRYERNVWATGQTVAYVNTPDVEQLRQKQTLLGQQLITLLTRAEMANRVSQLLAGHNPKADSLVTRLTNLRMNIPTDMLSSKQGKRFVWLSNNAATGMQNICVYTYPGATLDITTLLAMRDSIMRINLPGERQGMYMQTVTGSVKSGMEKTRLGTVLTARGLWEMHNDAMGGPFVLHAYADTARRQVIVAEAFVYAPEMKKRNLIRQAEASLYTLRRR